MQFRPGHLAYFVAVADAGQITRAAATLKIAQPALSQAIAQLESEVGFKLLERHARSVTLTPQGAAFLEKARAVVAADTEAVDVARSLARAERGTIELGYLGVTPEQTMPALTASFGRSHPDIAISTRELSFPSLPLSAWLAEVDAAILSWPAGLPVESGVWAVQLGEVRCVVVVPKSHPLAKRRELTVAEVLGEPLLGFHPSVAPAWASFWNLDEYRGGPAPDACSERVVNAKERFALVAGPHYDQYSWNPILE